MKAVRNAKLAGASRRDMHYDFIVIGAGIAGTSISYELAQTGRVCLIEGEARPGYHATGRSAALYAPSYGGRDIRTLTRASRAFFERPPAGFSEHALLLPRGCMYVARSDQQDTLAHLVREIRESGGNVAMMRVAEARALVPLLKPNYVAEAALDPDAMDIDVDALQQGYLRGARAAGTTVLTGHWIKQAARSNGLWHIELADGTASAPVLINAAGAWADDVAEICGAHRLGLQPLRRTALLVDMPAGVDARHWPAVIDADEQFYFKPDAGKLLISPADETPEPPGDAQPEELDVAIGVDRVQAAIDIEVRRVSHRWAGLRTFAPDRVPVIGFDAHVPGLFWCAGQGGYGIQTAPALARTAASMARNESLPPDVASEGLVATNVSPVRFEHTSAEHVRQG